MCMKYNLVIPGSGKKGISVNLPELSGKNLNESLQLLLPSLLKYLLLTFIAALPFGLTLFGDTTEEGSLSLFYIVGFIFISVNFLLLLLARRYEVFIDPSGFIPILVFALLITTASILTPDATEADTFGSVFMKSSGALPVLAFVGMFYITVYLLRSIRYLRLLYSTTTIGLVALFVLSLLGIDTTQLVPIALLFSLPFYGLYAFMHRHSFWFFLALSILTSIFILDNEFFSDSAWFIILLVSGLSGLFVISLSMGLKALTITSVLEDIKKEWSIVSKTYADDSIDINVVYGFSHSILKVILLLSPIFALSGALFLILNDSAVYDQVVTAQRDLFEAQVELFEDSDTIVALAGNGANSFSPGNSFINNIFAVHGLIGLLAYIVLFGTILYLSVTTFASSLKDTKSDGYLFAGFNLFLVVMIICTSFFTYLSVYGSALLWMLLAVSSVMHTKLDPDFHTLNITSVPIALVRKFMPLVVLVIYILAFILIYILVDDQASLL